MQKKYQIGIEYECKKCGGSWVSYLDHEPKLCSLCSQDWRTPKSVIHCRCPKCHTMFDVPGVSRKAWAKR